MRFPVLSENSRLGTEFLAKLRSDSNPAGVNHFQFFFLCLAGWVNRNQQNAIEYLQEEVKVLQTQEIFLHCEPLSWSETGREQWGHPFR